MKILKKVERNTDNSLFMIKRMKWNKIERNEQTVKKKKYE